MHTLLCAYFIVCSFYIIECTVLHWCVISSWCCVVEINSIQFKISAQIMKQNFNEHSLICSVTVDELLTSRLTLSLYHYCVPTKTNTQSQATLRVYACRSLHLHYSITNILTMMAVGVHRRVIQPPPLYIESKSEWRVEWNKSLMDIPVQNQNQNHNQNNVYLVCRYRYNVKVIWKQENKLINADMEAPIKTKNGRYLIIWPPDK